MSTQRYFNNSKSTLSTPFGSSDLVINLVSGSSFVNPGVDEYFLVTIDSGSQVEIVKASGVSGNTILVNSLSDRGWEGTGAQSFSAGARVECRVTAATLSTIISIANAAVSAETTSRGNADVIEHDARIAADLVLSNSISAESLLRANADTTLQNNINAEAVSRNSADASLAETINTEYLARVGTDVLLQTNIDAGKVRVGTIVAHATANGPGTGYIQLLPSIQYLSNTTYPDLYAAMAADGFKWGVGSGTFGIPWAKTGYSLIAGTPGSDTVGQAIAHTHTIQAYEGQGDGGGQIYHAFYSNQDGTINATPRGPYSTSSVGGAANLAAGTYVTFWIKY